MKLFRILLILVLTFSLTGALPLLSLGDELTPSLPTAIWTTDSNGQTVDKNLYASKQDVFLNGGPSRLDQSENTYAAYVKVTNPSGSVTLGSSTGLVQIGTSLTSILCLWENLITPEGEKGFNDTPNPGGEYKVWVSTDSSFPNDLTKTDNFKVKRETMTAKLQLIKYYDTNTNQQMDSDEPALPGWKIIIAGNGEQWPVATPYTDYLLEPGDYIITEQMPIEPHWAPTGPKIVPAGAGVVTSNTSVKVTLDSIYNDVTVYFGNIYLGKGNGLTLGFWSNKNGQKLVDGSDLAALIALNLRGVKGLPFDPVEKSGNPSYSVFRSWILNATATDMSYMLSAQLAAMKLNVLNGFVPGDTRVTTPLGFMSINELMDKANQALAAAPFDPSYQEQLKNALDAANNNNYVYVLKPNNPFDFPYTF